MNRGVRGFTAEHKARDLCPAAEPLGDDLVDTYLAVKRAELAAVQDLSDEEKCNWYADIY